MDDQQTNRVLETLRALMPVEILAGATPEDLAGGLLTLGAEIAVGEYGIEQTAHTLRRLADALERGE